jgi:hypothetical protein
MELGYFVSAKEDCSFAHPLERKNLTYRTGERLCQNKALHTGVLKKQ